MCTLIYLLTFVTYNFMAMVDVALIFRDKMKLAVILREVGQFYMQNLILVMAQRE